MVRITLGLRFFCRVKSAIGLNKRFALAKEGSATVDERKRGTHWSRSSSWERCLSRSFLTSCSSKTAIFSALEAFSTLANSSSRGVKKLSPFDISSPRLYSLALTRTVWSVATLQLQTRSSREVSGMDGYQDHAMFSKLLFLKMFPKNISHHH